MFKYLFLVSVLISAGCWRKTDKRPQLPTDETPEDEATQSDDERNQIPDAEPSEEPGEDPKSVDTALVE